mmetsp:Transcript_18389/g.55468  ORF Transcript_18389/g.55468 Transcript_18389/m.55468 type:complete len:201 (+) Transcript_18389:585-1187(+)
MRLCLCQDLLALREHVRIQERKPRNPHREDEVVGDFLNGQPENEGSRRGGQGHVHCGHLAKHAQWVERQKGSEAQPRMSSRDNAQEIKRVPRVAHNLRDRPCKDGRLQRPRVLDGCSVCHDVYDRKAREDLEEGSGEPCADHTGRGVGDLETSEVLEQEERRAERLPSGGRPGNAAEEVVRAGEVENIRPADGLQRVVRG